MQKPRFGILWMPGGASVFGDVLHLRRLRDRSFPPCFSAVGKTTNQNQEGASNMIYTEFQDKKLSALGFGTMRLPALADGASDEAQVAEMVKYALDNGVNYLIRLIPITAAWLRSPSAKRCAPIRGILIIFPGIRSAPATIPQRFLRNSSKSAAWTALIFICCTIFTKTPSRPIWIPAGTSSVISGNRSGAQSPASRREHSGVGLPFSAGHSRGDDDPVRHVRYAADAGERKDL